MAPLQCSMEEGRMWETLYRNGCRLIDRFGIYGRVKAIYKLKTDLDKGLGGTIEEFAALAAAHRGKEGRGQKGSGQIPHEAALRLINVHGVTMPYQKGWDYKAAVRLQDGSLALPRKRKFLCPISRRDMITDGLFWPYWPCPASPTGGSKIKDGEAMTEVRLAMILNGEKTSFVYWDGYGVMPQLSKLERPIPPVLSSYEGDCPLESDASLSQIHGSVRWAMVEADALEIKLEQERAAGKLRAKRERLMYSGDE